jgi:hypothetical protein
VRRFLASAVVALVGTGLGFSSSAASTHAQLGATAPKRPPIRCAGPRVTARAADLSGKIDEHVAYDGLVADLTGDIPLVTDKSGGIVVRYPRAKLVELVVRRAGRLVSRTRILPDGPGTDIGETLVPLGTSSASGVVCIARLAGERGPAVLVGGWLGGAHCCVFADVVYLAHGSKYARAVVDFGNPGFSLTELGDRFFFVGGDNRFAYLYADYADSAWPLVVDELIGGHLTDVSRQHPSLLAKDAAQHWKYVLERGDPYASRSSVDAWLADECRLGRGQAAWQVYLKISRSGILAGTFFGAYNPEILRRQLVAWRYCTVGQLA